MPLSTRSNFCALTAFQLETKWRMTKKMMRNLSTTFPSIKHPKPKSNPSKSSLSLPLSSSSSSSYLLSSTRRKSEEKSGLGSDSCSWCVYLILSTNAPIKTYIGVTTNFSRRLKQHNGELKGGAKASRAGRPWICACLVQGFQDRSEASQFESKWKSFSRKLPRKKKKNNDDKKQVEECSVALLQHRQAALNKVKGSFDCTHLEIDWHLNPL